MSDLQNPIFTDLNAAREALEAARWPSGPFCAKCGATDRQARVEGTKKSHRPGLIYCNHCKATYTVTVGTVFERSKVPLTKWWLATHLLTSSKKGMSAHQMHRMLGVTYKTAWFMCHRIREAMKDNNPTPMGGNGGAIEVDETYLGPTTHRVEIDKKGKKSLVSHRGTVGKAKIVTLVERNGRARSIHFDKRLTQENVWDLLAQHANLNSVLNTDEAKWYGMAGGEFVFHNRVNHLRGEYARGQAYTNTVEGYFSIFKRGMIGTYQHCGEQHLHRYLAEFDFRYSNRSALKIDDAMRAVAAMKGAEGKRLTYRRTH